MADDSNVGADTLALLEARLQRVTFALTGERLFKENEYGQAEAPTAAARLRTIERHLQTLGVKCEAAQAVLALHAKHPEVFLPVQAQAPETIDVAALAAIVLSHAHTYQQLATQLELCKTRAVPEPAELVPLVNLQPRIVKVAAKQKEQQAQLAVLRTRSAQVLEKWYAEGVLDMSERWADWEERLRDVEILVRRLEAGKRREEGFV